MDRQPPVVPPTNPSDPRATAVHVTGDNAVLPEIPGYRVIRKLGRGGMAEVYLANQLALDREVSVKVMERGALADETSMQRFENEARTIARLSHPNIVAIHEIGRTADGRLYYTMPFLPNGDLAQRDLGHDDTRIIHILRTLLSALDYAHQRGIVHRDVKLENVLFDADDRPLLADFGIALSRHEDVRITTAGFAVGSAGYMAPEQARGDAVDARADLYSVGVLTWELLTGELPFRSTDPLALALMHAQKDIPRLPAAKKHWQGFIDTAMAKDPAQRFGNARQMLDTLDRIGRRSGPLRLRPMPVRNASAAPSPARRLALIGAIAALAVAGGGYALRDRLPWHSPAPPVASAAVTGASVPAPAAPASGARADTTMPAPASPPVLAAPSAPPPAAATASAEAVAADRAHARLAHDELIDPAGSSAVDMALAAWELAPATPANKALANDLLQALGRAGSRAIAAGNDSRLHAIDDKATMFANATVGTQASGWKVYRTMLGRALAARAAGASGTPDALARTQALAAQLGLASALPATIAPASPGPANRPPPAIAMAAPKPTPASAPPAPPKPDGSDELPVDRGFVKLHGPIGIFPAAAVATTEVTRNQFAQFMTDSGRPASACHEGKPKPWQAPVAAPRRPHAPWRRAFERRYAPAATAAATADHSWNNPGFAQAGDHPVVCVSWADADAYARWRGQLDHRRYRLLSTAEWQMLATHGLGGVEIQHGTAPARSGAPNAIGVYGLDGNVSEWLADCGSGGCGHRRVAGRSWKGRGNDADPGQRPADAAYDDLGFRLVEILGRRTAAN
ncbi:MAG: protein kinase [Proteobacteria bacterium]|nr:protein kinase [Pseudomonadota bacterium]